MERLTTDRKRGVSESASGATGSHPEVNLRGRGEKRNGRDLRVVLLSCCHTLLCFVQPVGEAPGSRQLATKPG